MPTYLGLEAGVWDSDLSLVTKGGLTSFHKEIKQCHYVLGDTNADTEDTISLTSGIPQLGDVLRNTRCRKVTPKEVNTVRHPTTGVLCGLWKVDCEYDNTLDADQGDNNAGNQGGKDPTNQRPKRRWYSDKTTEVVKFNRSTGHMVQTTAGEQIYIEDDNVPQAVLEISRLERYPFDPDKIYLFTNRTNSEVFYGAPPGSALMDDITSEEETIEQEVYVRVSYSIKFRFKFRGAFDLGPIAGPENLLVEPGMAGVLLPDSWNIETPNIGYLYKPRLRYRSSSSGATIPAGGVAGQEIPGPAGVAGVAARKFIDANGQPKKVLLDADGALLPEGADPISIPVVTKYRTSFKPLNLEY